MKLETKILIQHIIFSTVFLSIGLAVGYYAATVELAGIIAELIK